MIKISCGAKLEIVYDVAYNVIYVEDSEWFLILVCFTAKKLKSFPSA